ncbi:hypothetical protein NPIL_460101 [Nephila pilipes]|uniref:Uncharacterized protein n=1 Tax=Nephila pilipes TaxID=299642 RepID=A0A8X6QGP1_NEPPI|nr:hypothetical protein NPIL_460101 [Nephila pilipes]
MKEIKVEMIRSIHGQDIATTNYAKKKKKEEEQVSRPPKLRTLRPDYVELINLRTVLFNGTWIGMPVKEYPTQED